MPTQRPTIKVDADTVKALDHLAGLVETDGKKSRHKTIRFAVQLSSLVVMWGRARDAGETTQRLEDFLRLATVALEYEFGQR